MNDPRQQQLTVILCEDRSWCAFRDAAPAERMPGELSRVEITQFGALDAVAAINSARAGEGRVVEMK